MKHSRCKSAVAGSSEHSSCSSLSAYGLCRSLCFWLARFSAFLCQRSKTKAVNLLPVRRSLCSSHFSGYVHVLQSQALQLGGAAAWCSRCALRCTGVRKVNVRVDDINPRLLLHPQPSWSSQVIFPHQDFGTLSVPRALLAVEEDIG